jgi:hypothetical protein
VGNQNKTVLAGSGRFRNLGKTWQGIKHKKILNTEDVKYHSPIKQSGRGEYVD